MACHVCQFENLPGLTTCARCGSPLTLTDVAIEPPRASALRLRTRAARQRQRLHGVLPTFGRLFGWLRYLEVEPVSWSAVAWSFIPGLGHLRSGRRSTGVLLLGAWLALLAVTLVGLGTGGDRLALGLASAVHAGAIIFFFAPSLAYERLVTRLAFGLVVLLAVHLLIYRPAAWAARHVAWPLALNNLSGAGTLQNGDVLLVAGRWLRPDTFRRGDLVVYHLQRVRGDGYIIPEGYAVDRIVGVAGDTITLDGGRLLVNGAPPVAGHGPLDALQVAASFEYRLAPDTYAIFPSQFPVRIHANTVSRDELGHIFRQLSVVDAAHIEARVLWRLRPGSRFGAVE